MGYSHARFLARTVLVKKNDIEPAMRMMNKMLSRDGLLEQYRRTRFYEKPTQTRRRINYERCKAIYDEDMKRRITFLLRTNRETPFPGCD